MLDYSWEVFLEEIIAVCEVTYGGVSYNDGLQMTFDRFTALVNKVDEVSKRAEAKEVSDG